MWLQSRDLTQNSSDQTPKHTRLPVRVLSFVWVFVSAFAGLLPNFAYAEGFTGGITPSRFELDANPGERLRRSVKVYNLGLRPQQYSIRTMEWDFSEAGQLSFSEALAEDSCRQWVRLERHRINVLPDPKRPRNYRFELEVPENEPSRECRFAIMIESLAQGVDPGFANGSVSMPITGRIAVIVYVNVGNVKAELKVDQLEMREINGTWVPTVKVQNTGQAHGRLDSNLIAKGPSGDPVRLALASSPILPGQTRYLPVSTEAGRTLEYPVSVRGKIYTEGTAFNVDQELAASQTLLAKQTAQD